MTGAIDASWMVAPTVASPEGDATEQHQVAAHELDEWPLWSRIHSAVVSRGTGTDIGETP
jgi:hypothetical protein